MVTPGSDTEVAQTTIQAPDAHIVGIPVGTGVEVRASFGQWRGRRLAHLRTWYLGKDARWHPTRRGVTVVPEQLEDLEIMVRALRMAWDEKTLGTDKD